MDIENEVYIWVESVEKNESGFLVQGIAFDGDFGFGKEGGRSFSGEVLIVSISTRKTAFVEISVAHVKGKGGVWQIVSDAVPAPPFLISSNHDLHGPNDMEINISPTASACEIFERDGAGRYPVVGSNIIGILDYMEGGSRLLFFSDRDDLKLSCPTEIFFSEWGISAGSIRP